MFTKVNRLFVLPFARNAEGGHRNSFSYYYVPNVQIKNFNVLIDEKIFFDLLLKNEEAYEKLLRLVEIRITQPVTYWILLVLKNITN